jgi:hypothetical protein
MINHVSSFRFAVNPSAVASVHEDGIVIFDMDNGRFYASNSTGAVIWRRIEEQLPLDIIADEISREYEVNGSTAREQVDRFVAELERNTLVQRSGRL